MQDILSYLKRHGERLDTEIAEALDIPLSNTQLHILKLAAEGEVVTCHLIRFQKGNKIEGLSCRLSGYTPKAAPGRKAEVQLALT